ncbi:hypothetical protein [Haloferax sp. DFSO60]|uniref:hypothetical protein n=1 Tax=Haloferax sp. DFSO60 TaxID=3388652 RepID=UPI00397992D4
MNKLPDAEFDIRRVQSAPWDDTDEEGHINPRRGVAIRAGDTWIPGEKGYIDTLELPFWMDVLEKLRYLHEGETTAVVLFPDGQAFEFERVDDDRISVMNHLFEQSIDDESKLLGIEERGTSSLTSLSIVTLQEVARIIDYARNAELTKSEANMIHRLEDYAQKLDWVASSSD